MLKSISLAIATLAISSVAMAADLPSSTGSTLTCAQAPTPGRASACEAAATTTPVGWTRKTPLLLNLDQNGGGNMVFTDGSSLVPWVSVTTNPSGYYNIIATFALLVSANQGVIIHSTDGATIDGLAFASRGY
jgi:hypothetical protein